MLKLDTISRPMRDVLIEHIDGCAPFEPAPVARPRGDRGGMPGQARRQVVGALVVRGWLRFERSGGGNAGGGGCVKARPRLTFITEEGRMALAAVLADMAEALVRARFAVPEVLMRSAAPQPVATSPHPSAG